MVGGFLGDYISRSGIKFSRLAADKLAVRWLLVKVKLDIYKDGSNINITIKPGFHQ